MMDLIVGELATITRLPLSTLAHHLRTLVSAELVDQERNGREIINRANFDAVTKVLASVTADCCTGVKLVEDAA